MLKNYSLFLLLALLWSFSFLGIKVSVNSFPPVFSAMLRVGVSFIVITLFFMYKKKKDPSKQIFFLPITTTWRLWATGLFTQSLPFAFLFYGEKFIAPALASIINSTVSIWALILGAIMFRDSSQLTPAKVIGLITGLIGIIFIFLPYVGHDKYSTLKGIFSVFMMAILYAVGGLMTQHLVFAKMKVCFESNLWHQHLASFVSLVMMSFLMEPIASIHVVFNIHVVFAILYLGIFATALAWIIYFYLLREWGTVRAASVMYIVPMLAILWDFVFMHLIPSWNEWAGVIAILSGVTLIQYQKK
jgi:drug/metabolite transporter (DMT)-like permease